MKNIWFLLTFLFVSCKTEILSPQNRILGEWRYVGTFSHLADYKCLICEDYNYDKSIYNLTFNADNSYSGRINLLIAQGNFTFKANEFSEAFESGDFANTKLQILNKPPQTEADSRFIEMFEDSDYFYVTQKSGKEKYSTLTLGKNGNNNFLLFAQK